MQNSVASSQHLHHSREVISELLEMSFEGVRENSGGSLSLFLSVFLCLCFCIPLLSLICFLPLFRAEVSRQGSHTQPYDIMHADATQVKKTHPTKPIKKTAEKGRGADFIDISL